jgi:CheY-like chemotaxis protein
VRAATCWRYRHTQDSPPTLLYIEDNPANLVLLEEILRFHTHLQLLSAPDAQRGIALAREHLPHVILMDMNLPGMSGAEAQHVLSEDSLTADIPVIALTANAMRHDVKAAMDAGFFDYITKPIKIDELLDAVNNALELSGIEPAAE